MSHASAAIQAGRRVALVAITRQGARLAAQLAAVWPHADLYVADRWSSEAGPRARVIAPSLAPRVAELFGTHGGLVLFTAVAVAVRLVAPHLRGKALDPAVVAVDDGGRFAVSVLSGHLGGGNALAAAVADALGCVPVVTTASEVHGIPPLDSLGRRWGWRLERSAAIKLVSAALVNGERVGWMQDAGEAEWWDGTLPPSLVRCASLDALDAAGTPGLVITDRLVPAEFADSARHWVVYRPRTLVMGVGASTGATAEEIEALARAALNDGGYAWESLRAIATIDRKVAEPGMVMFAERHALPLSGYSAAELAAVAVPHPSAVVATHVGTPSVCEAAALRAAGGVLVVPKRRGARATVALCRVGGERT